MKEVLIGIQERIKKIEYSNVESLKQLRDEAKNIHTLLKANNTLNNWHSTFRTCFEVADEAISKFTSDRTLKSKFTWVKDKASDELNSMLFLVH